MVLRHVSPSPEPKGQAEQEGQILLALFSVLIQPLTAVEIFYLPFPQLTFIPQVLLHRGSVAHQIVQNLRFIQLPFLMGRMLCFKRHVILFSFPSLLPGHICIGQNLGSGLQVRHDLCCGRKQTSRFLTSSSCSLAVAQKVGFDQTLQHRHEAARKTTLMPKLKPGLQGEFCPAKFLCEVLTLVPQNVTIYRYQAIKRYLKQT